MRTQSDWQAVIRAVAAGLILAAVCGSVPSGEAQPTVKEIEYLIHGTPADPTSPVAFRIKLTLLESDRDGDSIGWDITSIEIREVGNPDTVWVDDNPSVPTAVGLWWIEHLDPDEPTNDEFTMPPHMQGAATAEDPAGIGVSYDFEGKTYTPPAPPAEPPYEITAALDYAFTLVGGNDPIGSGEDEPVDMPVSGSGGSSG
jgi:hypothetical protein